MPYKFLMLYETLTCTQHFTHEKAFEEIVTAKLMSGDSSSLTFHVFEISSFLIRENQEFENSKNQQMDT